MGSVAVVDETHIMVNEAMTDSEALFVCSVDGCGRRLVIDLRRPGLTVLDRGDVWARHVGGPPGFSPGVVVAAP